MGETIAAAEKRRRWKRDLVMEWRRRVNSFSLFFSNAESVIHRGVKLKETFVFPISLPFFIITFFFFFGQPRVEKKPTRKAKPIQKSVAKQNWSGHSSGDDTIFTDWEPNYVWKVKVFIHFIAHIKASLEIHRLHHLFIWTYSSAEPSLSREFILLPSCDRKTDYGMS